MSPRDRLFQSATAAIVALHALAFLVWPGELWGVSHLAAWPRQVGLVWTGLALVALYVPLRHSHRPPFEFPGVRGSALIALASAVPFWILRERIHLFGDGALLVRDSGFSESVTRAPLLVFKATSAVKLGQSLGASVETSLAALSVASGVFAVFAILRLAATLTPDRGGRFVATALIGLAGSMQVFFGHIEYYAMLAAAVLLYLWLACRSVSGGRSAAFAWLLFALLPLLHLGTLALLPAQVYVASVAWRRGARTKMLREIGTALLVALAVAAVGGTGPRAGFGTTLSGVRRYLEPYFASESAKHTFGLLAPAHFLAVLNDLLLVAPVAFAGVVAILWSRGRPVATPSVGPDTVSRRQRFLGLAALGGLLFSFLFHRELGPYRDWDLLSWNGFVLLALVAACFVEPHPHSQRQAFRAAVVGGLFHLVPWIALQVSPHRAIAHAEIVLRSGSQQSPHARGYLYEEIAIWHRRAGNEDASLRAYEAAVASNPADARYHVGLGTRYAQRGEFEPAIAEFESALRVRPDFAPALNNLAFALFKVGRDLEVARSHIDRALALDPENADYMITKARILLALGDREGARRSVEGALRVRPDMPEAKSLQNDIAR